jgi:2-methylcitrate dehydratase PrpD
MTLKDGRVLKKYIEHVIGSVARPMSDADLDAKFRALVKGILQPVQTEKLIEVCWNVGKLKNAAQIASAAVPVRGKPKVKTPARKK